MGQALLKEAVLDVLFHAYKKESLKPKEISKRAGIYPGTMSIVAWFAVCSHANNCAAATWLRFARQTTILMQCEKACE